MCQGFGVENSHANIDRESLIGRKSHVLMNLPASAYQFVGENKCI
jgi:hypothetical protein